MVGAEVQRGLLGGGCGDGASYTPVKAAASFEESSVESTGLSFSSFWDWHSLSNKVSRVRTSWLTLHSEKTSAKRLACCSLVEHKWARFWSLTQLLGNTS